MASRAKSIPELVNLSAPENNDLLVIVDVSAANATKKTTVGAVAATVANGDLIMANGTVLSAASLQLRANITPATGTTLAVPRGTMFFDANYLYIAVDTNLVKRIPLQDF